jgi:putative phosphoribosyl transferase
VVAGSEVRIPLPGGLTVDADLPVGYFGASTGAAAALLAAALWPEGIAAVVSRGGRPDLAGNRLAQVRCPTAATSLLRAGSASGST